MQWRFLMQQSMYQPSYNNQMIPCNMCHNSGSGYTAQTQQPSPMTYMGMGGSTTETMPAYQEQADLMSQASDVPETLSNPIYVPGYLERQIGKIMRVEFLIGNTITDRVGRLVEVGASYIVLRTFENSRMLCDLYSIKFATIVQNEVPGTYPGL